MWTFVSTITDRYVCTISGKKVKPLILRHPQQGLAGPVGLIRRFQSEQFRALLRVEESPRGKPPGIDCEGRKTSHMRSSV